MVLYNLTDIADVNSSIEFIQNVNTQLTGGWFGSIVLISIFVIVYIAFIFATNQPVKSIVGASFICMALSWIMVILGLVPVTLVFVFLAATAVSVAFWKVD